MSAFKTAHSMAQPQSAHTVHDLAAWFTTLSPAVQAALIAGAVGLVVLIVRTTASFLSDRSQRSLDRERLALEKAANARRVEQEQLADARAFQTVAQPMRVIISSIVQSCLPVYVRGNIDYEAWGQYNNDLKVRLERDDAAERLGAGYRTLWDFYAQSAFTHNFIVGKVTDRAQLDLIIERGGDVFPTLTIWLREVFYGAADALDALGNIHEAEVIRETYRASAERMV